MKNFVSILVLGSAIALSSCDKGKDSYKSIPCIPNGMSNAIIAFYPFSNGSLNDLSGNNNHLTNPSTASSAMDRNGNLNCAYEFDNLATSSEFLTSVNTSFLNNLTKFSISVWYQAKDTTRAGSDFEGLVHRGVGQSCPDRLGQWCGAVWIELAQGLQRRELMTSSQRGSAIYRLAINFLPSVVESTNPPVASMR